MTNLDSDLEKVEIQTLVEAQALDLWLCNYYKVLPTEDRFKKLGEEQKYLLFSGYLEQPLAEDVHKAYQQRDKEGISNDTATNLKKAGYTQEQIDRMREELSKAGL